MPRHIKVAQKYGFALCTPSSQANNFHPGEDLPNLPHLTLPLYFCTTTSGVDVRYANENVQGRSGLVLVVDIMDKGAEDIRCRVGGAEDTYVEGRLLLLPC